MSGAPSPSVSSRESGVGLVSFVPGVTVGSSDGTGASSSGAVATAVLPWAGPETVASTRTAMVMVAVSPTARLTFGVRSSVSCAPS